MGGKDRKSQDKQTPKREQRSGRDNRLLRNKQDGIKRMGYRDARSELGFTGHRAMPELALSKNDFSFGQQIQRPERLARDDMHMVRDMLVGGSMDLFDDDYERKKRAWLRLKMFKKLKNLTGGARQMGDFFDKENSVSHVRTAFSPHQASIEPNYKGRITLVLKGNGKRIDVSSADIPRLVYFTLKHGKDWVYSQIDDLEQWDHSGDSAHEGGDGIRP